MGGKVIIGVSLSPASMGTPCPVPMKLNAGVPGMSLWMVTFWRKDDAETTERLILAPLSTWKANGLMKVGGEARLPLRSASSPAVARCSISGHRTTISHMCRTT